MAPRPENLFDDVPTSIPNQNGKLYTRGKFLGKGGFARCYEFITPDLTYLAGKVVPKKMLQSVHQKEKMVQEVAIQRALKHSNVVKFVEFFEDDKYVYIVLEMCRNRSLMELHKRRKTITETEARYFIQQIVTGCQYLHDSQIIHRDLKLANLFIDEEMRVKIGDFGLATRVDFPGEKKKTLCGTPNYIAPEVLHKKGHSFEVDAWSLGCILYTLLIGRPPFETSSLKDTYQMIKTCKFKIPPNRVTIEAEQLICGLLNPEVTRRLTMNQVAEHPWLNTVTIPLRLPMSCLSMAPREEPLPPLRDHNPQREAQRAARSQPVDCYIQQTKDLLSGFTLNRPDTYRQLTYDEAEDPNVAPVYWVSRWVDYSDKYGLGYQLNDKSFGVLFNDNTRIMLHNAGDTVQYIGANSDEAFHTLQTFPETMRKKVTLLNYFKNYMNENLAMAGDGHGPVDKLARLPFLRTWFRTRTAIILHLSNGSLQLNFFEDHAKIIICPVMQAVTLLEKDDMKTFKFDLLSQFGVNDELYTKICYAKTMVDRLQQYRQAKSRSRQNGSANVKVEPAM